MANDGSNNGRVVVSIWRDLKDIWSKATLLATLITIPTFAFNGLLGKMLEPVKPIGDIIILSWPLVCTATIFFMMIKRRWFDGKSGINIFWVIVAIIVTPYLVALFFGVTASVNHKLANPGLDWLTFLHPGQALVLAGDIAHYYFSTYGIWRALSAISCGAFLAWAFEMRILPRVRSLQEKVQLGLSGDGSQ